MADERYISKVVLGDRTLIDITDSSFDENLIPAGSVVYNSAGRRISGSAIVYNVQKDTTANWNSKIGYVPEKNDVIIYSDHGQMDDGFGNTIDVPAIKIGDGNAYLVDLPFVGDDVRYQILTELRSHTGNSFIHVTQEEKEFWNNKLNCTVNNGNLILNRL